MVLILNGNESGRVSYGGLDTNHGCNWEPANTGFACGAIARNSATKRLLLAKGCIDLPANCGRLFGALRHL